jgi:hypothetical protein
LSFFIFLAALNIFRSVGCKMRICLQYTHVNRPNGFKEAQNGHLHSLPPPPSPPPLPSPIHIQYKLTRYIQFKTLFLPRANDDIMQEKQQ